MARTMVKSINKRLANEYPEILDLSYILALAEITWPKYGLSAKDLSEQDDYLLELIKIISSQL